MVDEPQAQGLHALLRVAQLRQLPLQRRLRERRHSGAALGSAAAPTGPARPRSVPASPPQRGRSRASPVPSRLAGRHFRAPRQPGANKMAAAEPPGEPPAPRPAPLLLLPSLPAEAHNEAARRGGGGCVPERLLPLERAPPSRLSRLSRLSRQPSRAPRGATGGRAALGRLGPAGRGGGGGPLGGGVPPPELASGSHTPRSLCAPTVPYQVSLERFPNELREAVGSGEQKLLGAVTTKERIHQHFALGNNIKNQTQIRPQGIPGLPVSFT